MRVLVTGGAGLVGSRVVRRLLDRGHDVHAVLRADTDSWRIADVVSRLHVIRGDVRAPRGLAPMLGDARPDACLHLAWCATPGIYLTSSDNVELLSGTLQLAMMLNELGCGRFIGVGTCFEYDTDEGWLHESTRLDPRFLYSAAKAGVYLALRQLLPTTFAWARLFYLYGPGEDRRRFVPSVIQAVLRDEPARCSPGTQVRDFLHIDDAAAALVAILESGVAGAFNIGSGVPITVADLARRLGERMGRLDLVRLGALPADARDPAFICADTRRLRAETGWRPVLDLDHGLDDTIAWWKARGEP